MDELDISRWEDDGGAPLPPEPEEPEPETDAGQYYLEHFMESAEDYRRHVDNG